jgi:hypothetical protein
MYFIKCTKVLSKHLLVYNHDTFSSICLAKRLSTCTQMQVKITSSARVNLVDEPNFVTTQFKRLIMFRFMNQFAFLRLDLFSYLTANIQVILIWHVNVYTE